MPSILETGVSDVHVAVGFYDDADRALLLQLPTAGAISALVSSGLTMPVSQFLTYYLFFKRWPGKPGYRGFTEISHQIQGADAELRDFVALRDGSLVSTFDGAPPIKSIVERVGEAVALAVISKIHGLHEADWNRIQEQQGRDALPTFDYEREVNAASDGLLVVQLEAKGTAATTQGQLGRNIKRHKRAVVTKKVKILQAERQNRYEHPADLRYGVITALAPDTHLRCWLTDPPGDNAVEARRHRLLARMRYIFQWVSFLVGRSQFAASLGTRLLALTSIPDPFELAGVRLVRGNGLPFDFPPTRFRGTRSLFRNLCSIGRGDVVGRLMRMSDGNLLFLGVRHPVFTMASNQDFEEVLRYGHEAGSRRQVFGCATSAAVAKRLELPQERAIDPRDRSRVTFRAPGILHFSQGGAVFGFIKPTA